jgi:hypothetical protein
MFGLNDVAFLGSLSQAPVTDPNFANVSLLLHGDGANGSTTIIDSSPWPKTVTAVGNAQISTAQSKFGGSSIAFDGTGDFLTVPDATTNNLPSDFTIEAWVYFSAYSASFAGLFGALLVGNYRAGGSGNQGWQLRVNGTASSYTTINVYTGTTDLSFPAGTLALNTWHHIAASRSGSSLRAFANGTQAGSTSTNSDNLTHNLAFTRNLRVGELDDATYKFGLNGYIDDLRITKGIARYTANFTPPTAPFPDAFAAAIAFDFLDPANIGMPVGGGYFGGLISHTADGNPTHALIVAPAATGATGTGYTLTTNLAWKTTDTSTAGTTSLFDGVANTAAMVAAGIADHPAAQFCTGLTIGGFNDWYFPSQLEKDIVYFNLKPTTTSNATGTGTNAYAVPPRTANYTAGNPVQTAVAAFQAGGAEAFAAAIHWASNEGLATNARRINYGNGASSVAPKSALNPVRAFRRIAL